MDFEAVSIIIEFLHRGVPDSDLDNSGRDKKWELTC